MIQAILRGALRHPGPVVAGALLLCAAGAWATLRTPVDVFPDLTAPTVTVLTEAQSMTPSEIEAQVTFPLETAMSGSPGVRRVRSATASGLSIVWVEFDWGEDPFRARQVVTEKMQLAAATLPEQADLPVLAPMSSIMGEILFLALTSDRHSPMELRSYAENVVRRTILAVPGIAQVAPIGGDEKQYQVVLAPERLRARGLTLAEVAAALSAANQNVSAGFLVEGGAEFGVLGVGRLRGTEDIGASVVPTRDGVPVRAHDLGDVIVGAAPRRGDASANRVPAVVLGVTRQPAVNTLAVTRDIERVVASLRAQLPEGMKLEDGISRQADFIEVAVRNVGIALRDGAFLVVLVVLAFLGNFRASFISLSAIPLSLLAAILVLHQMGATLNTMTLGGLAIAVGALVDDAVIDVENVFRRLRENALLPAERRRSALDVVFAATSEIRGSIVFATAIIGLVFLPLLFLAGVEGRLLRPLGLAYVTALAASLAVALTVTPVLCLLLLPRAPAVTRGVEPRLSRALKRGYGRLLAPVLARPGLVLAATLPLLVMAIFLATRTGGAFLPEFNEGSLTISVGTLPGTSLDESARLAGLVEDVLLAQEEVVLVARKTGRAERDEHAQGVEASELDVSLAMRARTRDEFLADLRRDLTTVPGVHVTIGQPISHRIDHMLSGTRASIAVKIFGDDLSRMRAVAERARAAMAAVPGVVDLSVEPQVHVPLLRVLFKRDAIARHGMQIADVARSLEAGVQGLTVSRLLEGRSVYDLVVRLRTGNDARARPSIRDVSELLVDAPSGERVPLHALADLFEDRGPNLIQREQGERRIIVQCNTAGRDLASVVEDVRGAVDPIVAASPGHRVEYGGQFASAEEARRRILLVSVGVLAAIGFLLHLAFRSARDALLVLVNLPLALIGGVAGVWLGGGVVSVASWIGFIALFGIATRNGIMLVQHIRHLQLAEGVTDFHEAVRRGALERLNPILMTALATALALIPLALGAGDPGNEIQAPMAQVILWGLLSSTFLNMIVVPALYLRFGRPAVPPPVDSISPIGAGALS